MEKVKIRKMTLCSLFVTLIIVGSFIKVPIPYIPFTLQFLFTNLSGVILGANLGALSVFLYLFMGFIGLPVFTEGGGVFYIFKPTFGYLIGFLVGSYVSGKFLEKKEKNFKNILIASIINILIVYIIGVIYLYIISNFYLGGNLSIKNAIIYGAALPVIGDLILCLISAEIGKRILSIGEVL